MRPLLQRPPRIIPILLHSINILRRASRTSNDRIRLDHPLRVGRFDAKVRVVVVGWLRGGGKRIGGVEPLDGLREEAGKVGGVRVGDFVPEGGDGEVVAPDLTVFCAGEELGFEG